MDDSADNAQSTDEPQADNVAEVRMIWQSAPAACARCSRDLYAPRPVAKAGEDLLCYDCVHRHLRPERFYSNYRGDKLPEPPDAVILWWNERGVCSVCSHDLRTPGAVGVTPKGPVCSLCLDFEAPTLAWILRLATGVQQAQGYWPGMPRLEHTPMRGSKEPEPADWSKAKKTDRWPSAIEKIPGSGRPGSGRTGGSG